MTAGAEPAVFFLQVYHRFGLHKFRANQMGECVIYKFCAQKKIFQEKEIFRKSPRAPVLNVSILFCERIS
ncbi:MAG: hypothetical protein DMG67_03945 [Acidobacteria bacterium]|nr:MAG: hypothetical protein DMG67_03945 [Acidobacteriota bacterium]